MREQLIRLSSAQEIEAFEKEITNVILKVSDKNNGRPYREYEYYVDLKLKLKAVKDSVVEVVEAIKKEKKKRVSTNKKTPKL